MKIVQCMNGRNLNLEHAREYGFRHFKDGDRERFYLVGTWSDGTTINTEILESTYDQLQYGGDVEPPRLVPSPPGYWQLFLGWDQDGVEYLSREAVIAWEFDKMGGFHGVYCANCYPGATSTAYVKSPDGTVCNPGDQQWDNEEEWLKHMREEREKEIEREKARALKVVP